MITLFTKKVRFLLLGLLAGLFLSACGGGSSDGGGEFGTLKTSLTDASTDEYQAVYVTVDRVDVHLGGEGSDDEALWETVAEPQATYNLLELVNGIRETLGIASLPAGHYTQMRLIIGSTPDGSLNIFSQQHRYANYLIDQSGEEIELKVPSGTQTGLKIVNGFDISADQTTELILDFDAMRSVVKAGSSGNYLLKPTVKVLNTVENAIVSGTVQWKAESQDPAILAPVAGALVMAQVYIDSAALPEDQVVIEAGTVSETNGEYALFLKPGTYNLVATEPNYSSACLTIDLQAGETAGVDFTLVADNALPGTVTGFVSLSDAAATDQFATIDFRRETECADQTSTAAPVMVTVKSINIADLTTYSVDLLPGNYQIVASSFGLPTRTFEVSVSAGGPTVQDISFSVP